MAEGRDGRERGAVESAGVVLRWVGCCGRACWALFACGWPGFLPSPPLTTILPLPTLSLSLLTLQPCSSPPLPRSLLRPSPLPSRPRCQSRPSHLPISLARHLVRISLARSSPRPDPLPSPSLPLLAGGGDERRLSCPLLTTSSFPSIRLDTASTPRRPRPSASRPSSCVSFHRVQLARRAFSLTFLQLADAPAVLSPSPPEKSWSGGVAPYYLTINQGGSTSVVVRPSFPPLALFLAPPPLCHRAR